MCVCVCIYIYIYIFAVLWFELRAFTLSHSASPFFFFFFFYIMSPKLFAQTGFKPQSFSYLPRSLDYRRESPVPGYFWLPFSKCFSERNFWRSSWSYLSIDLFKKTNRPILVHDAHQSPSWKLLHRPLGGAGVGSRKITQDPAALAARCFHRRG
jgi:hypothetical protein